MKKLNNCAIVAGKNLILLATSILCFACGPKTGNVQIGNLCYYLNYNYTAEVVKYERGNEYPGDVVIPETIEYESSTYSVTSIREHAFYCCNNMTSITIPNSVTSIGANAFEGCVDLNRVTIPNSVTEIGYGAFLRCKNLSHPIYNAHVFAFLPRSYYGAYAIPQGIEQIAGMAFCGCDGLTSVTIPNGVTEIEFRAFYRCSNLTSVTILNSDTRIYNFSFEDCPNARIYK